MFKNFVLAALLLTFGIVVLGAYVRLKDAGLGCPDWPGCYGHIGVPGAADLPAAQARFPDKPIEAAKGWIEMVHRYFASSLGLLLIVIAAIAIRKRNELAQSPALPVALVGVVIFQGMLGMWTVTLLLKPAIVTAHLIGGMTILALLTWLALRQFPPRATAFSPALKGLGVASLVVLAGQIVLGGWVSTNYAALACGEFPTCQGAWLPVMEFDHAFHIFRELGMTPDGQSLNLAALTAIHWTHRLGALVTMLVLGALAYLLARVPASRGLGIGLAALLFLQLILGVLNVVWDLPLALAVAHNAVAALLLVKLVLINHRLHAAASARLPTYLRAAA
jgi:cytochrome c oxidase assembly protein subunit 15